MSASVYTSFPDVALQALEPRLLLAGAPIDIGNYDIGVPGLTDLWVDPVSGDDANTGATRAAALRTVTEAWDRVPAGADLTTTGYRIQLMAGTYAESAAPTYWENRHGTYAHPIILQSADGAGTASLPAVNMADCRYVYFIGLSLSAGGGDVLHLEQCSHMLVRQDVLTGIGDIHHQPDPEGPQETLKVNQSQYIYVEDSDLSGAWGNALDFVAVQYGHIFNNRIHHAVDWAMYLKGGSAYFRIEGNEIYDAGTGGFSAGQGSGFEFMVSPWLHYEASGIQFVNNVIHDTDGAGMGVNGGYDILLANNTLYRVGSVSHVIEVTFGLRSCDGNTTVAAANLAAGGWGTTLVGSDHEQPIPSRNVFIYDNLVYNPAPFRSQWQQFTIPGPQTPAAGTHIPSPAYADTNLQIRGNVIWNGPADLYLGLDDSRLDPAQVLADNAINAIEPQLADPAGGDFHLASGSNVLTATTYAPPDFTWAGAPASPAEPAGNLSNAVPRDREGNARTAGSPAGAYAPAAPQHLFFLHQSVGQGIMEDHNGHPGLVSRMTDLGHVFGDYNLWDTPPGGSTPMDIAALFADANGDGQYGDAFSEVPALNGARDADILMLKSCFYTLDDLADDADLTAWEQAFITSVAPYANQHPTQKLVVMPAAPQNRSAGLDGANADRGRQWADWLAGTFRTAFCTAGNVYDFDLFDCLASPIGSGVNANYLRPEYRQAAAGESHPNDTGYSAAADALAAYLIANVLPGGAVPTNHAPVAVDDVADVPVNAADFAIDVLANDTDSDHDALTVTGVTAPRHGTAGFTAAGVTYSPPGGYSGPDSFRYSISDGRGGTATGNVSLTVRSDETWVTIGQGGFMSATYIDPDGTAVTVTLTRGSAVLHVVGADVRQISSRGGVTVTDDDGRVTLADVAVASDGRGTLTFKTRGGTVAGAAVGQITGATPLATLNASTITLGTALIFTGAGYVGNVKLADLSAGAQVRMDGSGPARGITFRANDIGAGVGMAFASGLRKFTAARWAGGALTAPWATTIKIAGNPAAGLAGDLSADMTFTGHDGAGFALRRLTVAGTVSNCSILAQAAAGGEAGSIGTVTAGRMVGSILAAGFVPADPADPMAGGTFQPGLAIARVEVRGIRGNPGGALVDSLIAAATVAKVTLASADTRGTRSFGVLADEVIGQVTCRSPFLKWLDPIDRASDMLRARVV